MHTKRKIEYSLVDDELYMDYLCFANSLIAKIAFAYHIHPTEVRYYHAINFLITHTSVNSLSIFFNKPIGLENVTSQERLTKSKIQDFNYYLYKSKIFHLKAKNASVVESKLSEELYGYSFFFSFGAILGINFSENNVWPRIIFTFLHELIHVYLGDHYPKYRESAIVISQEKLSNMKLPDKLVDLETEANIIASLLYVPECSLVTEILRSPFNKLEAIYNISDTALFNRLHNFFKYSCHVKDSVAIWAADAYRKKDLHSIELIKRDIISTRQIFNQHPPKFFKNYI